ncbi:hypothetical protein QRD02_11850 [Aequorivita sp. SDUM287046]|uniref:Lipoprotein n=1 Tax=Aequorivita aurantiaca TaxID=3053356 RepID=A0ABT8DJS8_9FLAO|nr:hypothetical protein [Aequorivita aurantiaca]MDN3725079.1 hypothetical protein [Aequorivita aurantiaca]
MKKIAFIFLTLLIVACSSDKKHDNVVRELAKKDVIEKLQLPEGTKFVDEDIEMSEAETPESTLEVIYIVKVTVKSEDREGNENIKTYILNYKKIDEDGSDPNDYELLSFE